MNDIKLPKTDKEDHFRLIVNGVDIFGEQERSVYKHLIEVMDNSIYKY